VKLSNHYGCDSLVITATAFNPAGISVTSLSVKNCNPAAVGIDTVFLKNKAGCDSLVITTTSLAPVSQTFLSATSCNPNLVGIDTVTLSNHYGCDSLIITSVTYAGLDFKASTRNALCLGGKDGLIRIDTVLTTFMPVELLLDNHPVQIYTGEPIKWTNLVPGKYTLSATNPAGCTATREVNIAEGDALHLDLGQQPVSLHLGDSIWVEPTANFQIEMAKWLPLNGVLCPACAATFIAAGKTGIYTLTASDPNGCSTSASLTVQVDQRVRVYVPNAIHPGSGSQNAKLVISSGPEVERIRSLQIFDRWGNQLFEQHDLAPNTPSAWDGTYNGKLINPGVLIWVCKVETIDGQVLDLSGDITVLR
jgi:hypothetical protein